MRSSLIGWLEHVARRSPVLVCFVAFQRCACQQKTEKTAILISRSLWSRSLPSFTLLFCWNFWIFWSKCLSNSFIRCKWFELLCPRCSFVVILIEISWFASSIVLRAFSRSHVLRISSCRFVHYLDWSNSSYLSRLSVRVSVMYSFNSVVDMTVHLWYGYSSSLLPQLLNQYFRTKKEPVHHERDCYQSIICRVCSKNTRRILARVDGDGLLPRREIRNTRTFLNAWLVP